MTLRAILFDFDGVLIDSEWVGNCFIADHLTAAGHPTRPEQAIEQFMGTAGESFEAAVSRWTGEPFPDSLREARMRRGLEMLEEGVPEVAGARDFVLGLPADLPIAVTSAAITRWIAGHLGYLGLSDRFGPHLYSAREHVTRLKPAPDIYLHAADRLGVDIRETMIIEDSPLGIEGAVASGAHVVGLLAGSHIRDGHGERLLAKGAHRCVTSFEEIARLYF